MRIVNPCSEPEYRRLARTRAKAHHIVPTSHSPRICIPRHAHPAQHVSPGYRKGGDNPAYLSDFLRIRSVAFYPYTLGKERR